MDYLYSICEHFLVNVVLAYFPFWCWLVFLGIFAARSRRAHREGSSFFRIARGAVRNGTSGGRSTFVDHDDSPFNIDSSHQWDGGAVIRHNDSWFNNGGTSRWDNSASSGRSDLGFNTDGTPMQIGGTDVLGRPYGSTGSADSWNHTSTDHSHYPGGYGSNTGGY